MRRFHRIVLLPTRIKLHFSFHRPTILFTISSISFNSGGALFLGETVSVRLLISGAIILSGVALAVVGRR